MGLLTIQFRHLVPRFTGEYCSALDDHRVVGEPCGLLAQLPGDHLLHVRLALYRGNVRRGRRHRGGSGRHSGGFVFDCLRSLQDLVRGGVAHLKSHELIDRQSIINIDQVAFLGVDIRGRRQRSESLLKRGTSCPWSLICRFRITPSSRDGIRKLGAIHSDSVEAVEEAAECADQLLSQRSGLG